MSVIYGLVDQNGNIISQKGKFNVQVTNQGKNFIIEFECNMLDSVVVATPRFFRKGFMFDRYCTPIVVSNASDSNNNNIDMSLCTTKDIDNNKFGFSFIVFQKIKFYEVPK